MKKGTTIFLWVVAIGIVTFAAIYEPLTQSTRERAFRDGIVFERDPARVDTVRVATGSSVFELRRKGDGWQIGPDLKDRADPKVVDKLLKTICSVTYLDRIKASEFKSEDDLAPYGLNKPKRKIEIRGGGENATIYLGKDGANDSRVYARLDDDRDVFLIDDEIEDTAFRNPSELRDKRLTDLDPSRVDRFTIRQDGGLMELTRTATGWRIVKPLNAAADDVKVQKYLKEFLQLPIQEFIADDTGDISSYGVAEGQREISIYADGIERPQSLRLGSEPPGFAGTLYAQATGRDAIVRISGTAQDFLTATPGTLRDRRLLPLNIDMVDAIRIESPKGKIDLRRKGEGWVIKSGKETTPAKAEIIYDLVRALGDTTVTKYASAPSASPASTITFLSVLSENTPEATAGEHPIAKLEFFPPEGGMVMTRVSDAAETGLVPQKVLDSLPLDSKAWGGK
jgi:hypothetical protein